MSLTSQRLFNDDNFLSRSECIDIYRRTTMGKRVAEAIVNFVMNAERDISIQDAPQEVIEEFKKKSTELQQDIVIKNTLILSRVLGTAGLFVALRKIDGKEDYEIIPTFNEIHNYQLRFQTIDKMALSSTVLDTNPLSFNFLEPKQIKIQNKVISKKRITLSSPSAPIYLNNTSDLIPYSAPSVYYNMVKLLDEYEEAIDSLSSLLYKAGVITYKYASGSKLTGIKIEGIEKSKEIIKQIENGEVLAIDNKSELQDFPINNISGLVQAVDKLEEAITKALNDTPASILFDKNLSKGLSEGTEDMKSLIMALENYRETKLKPLYQLTDYYVMLSAWNNDFTTEIQNEYKERYAGWTLDKMRREWVKSFSYKFGNLFPATQKEINEDRSIYIDNLIKLQQLGASMADIESELNESKIFDNEIELQSNNDMFNSEVGELDDNLQVDNIDYFDFEDNDEGDFEGMLNINECLNEISNKEDLLSLSIKRHLQKYSNLINLLKDNNKTVHADANSPIPEGSEWKTLDNGEHILVKDGEVLAGAGGVFSKNKTQNNENNENNEAKKTTETETEKNYDNVKDITKKEYASNKSALLHQNDLLKFEKNELERTHPNDKFSIKEHEENIERIQKKINELQLENEKYELNNKDTVKQKAKKPEKEEKVGKTKNISYDDETINKLKELGKNWQDKRIYFKELDNGYYDLINEKWVTDSPDLTRKALLMASENESERAERLSDEKAKKEQEKKEKEEAERQAIKQKQAEEKPTVLKIVDRLKNLNKFTNEVKTQLNEKGIHYGAQREGQVKEITDALFTKEEQDAWKGLDNRDPDYQIIRNKYYQLNNPLDYSLYDFIHIKIQNAIESEKERLKPLQWKDWIEATDDTAIDQYGNNGAWEKYKDEYQEYKATEAKKKEEYFENVRKGIFTPHVMNVDYDE